MTDRPDAYHSMIPFSLSSATASLRDKQWHSFTCTNISSKEYPHSIGLIEPLLLPPHSIPFNTPTNCLNGK
ncbi:uncharacterized protein BO88DRAFT_63621 [Aspergillus vadensis CBS 113365]|uniref:Uncharacterized protein n=1 Tax=Aspergillus vadensis (strain CBS 113365 / IMI 142717 / IBT 24658) TaxID=1448311 RepID=A0A319B7F4_ASPVC|nr:hypothetical protein BO88DRAFT_63621 [Aspergillus vadensis CBS 113365]PYH68707.1 hypothetical protein BO88DRAFT_63621 [Aspergillus vadensis CBS 113365]